MARTTIPAELVAVNAIQGTLIADNSVTAVHIATNAISGTLVADNAVTSTHIAQNQVTATQIAQNTITVTQMADDAIETAKINASAVTTAKINNGAVTDDKLAANSVTSAKIVNGTIVAADLADNAVTIAKMASLARGKIIYGDSAGDPAALALGSAGTFLISDGTDISWGNSLGSGDRNLGIGAAEFNSSNYSTLNLRGTTGGQLLVGRNSGANNWDFFLFTTDSLTRMGTAAGDDLAIHTNSTGSTNEAMRIDSSGNVGIGTTDPQYKFDVYGTDDITMRIHRPSSALGLNDTCGIGFSQRGDTNTSSSDTRAGIFSTYNGSLHLCTEPGGNLNSNPVDHAALSIDGTDQNIGIGTTSPSKPLHLKRTSGWATMRLEGASDSGGELEFYKGSTKAGAIFFDNSNNLNIRTSNTERMRIYSDGQVTKPYQSGFYAVKSNGQTISVNQAVIFNTTTENVGGDYNTSNGVYTAPYSGFYIFSYTILLGASLSNDIDVDHYLKTSNRNYIGGMPGRIRYLSSGATGWGDGYMGLGHVQIAYMDAGDTAYVDFSQLYYNNSNGTAPVYANTGNNWTKFSGYFLG